MGEYLTIAGLALIMTLTLILPFSVKKVEEELEAFLFVMGLAAVTVSGQWRLELVEEALREPVMITLAVLALGFVFRAARPRFKGWLDRLITTLGPRRAVFALILFLGLGSSLTTAIIAALALAELVSLLKFDRDSEIKITVYACFAIGLGAALTPIGEPLSTITVAKLKEPPHNAGFFFLLEQIGLWVLPGVLAAAFLAGRCAGGGRSDAAGLTEDARETGKSILLRGLKVYIFVMALIFLGGGLLPLAERFVPGMPAWGLFWINSLSAVLDNATLAAAELVPILTEKQVKFALMSLLVSGGMLIPGNIPNIICAAKLGIKSREWAGTAIPFGAALMAAYFAALTIFVK